MPLALALALGMVTLAAYIDLRTRRIPNWLTVGMLAAGLVVNVWELGAAGFGVALAGCALGLVLLLPFYVVGGMGAGDVKLLGAVGALVGPQTLVSVAIYGALVGGTMSLVALAARGSLIPAVTEILAQQRLPARSGLKLPYGLAIASGVYLSLVLPALVG